MNGWERHGITHVSASHCNLWGENPALCMMRYLGGIKDEDSPAAWRGKAVEDGLTALLHGRDPLSTALTTFEANAQGEISDEISAQRRLIEPMCNRLRGVDFGRGELVGTQVKIEYWLDGVPVPFIGYIDFNFESGVVDLKTTQRLPSSPKISHVRQVALYSAAKDKPADLLYVTDKKYAMYHIAQELCAQALIELRSFALSEERFLARIDSVQDALHCLPFNSDDWRVGPATLEAHRVLLGAVQ